MRDLTGAMGLPCLSFKSLPVLFDYDLYCHVNYLYALAVLFVLFMVVRLIVYSPFGQTLAGIRENVARMHAIGSPVHLRLVVVYTISAAIAGVAGALFTQTNQYVTLGVFDFDNSAGVLVMLVLGGIGRLYGAFVGAVIYMVLQDTLSKASPQYWQFAVGLLLVLTLLFQGDGLIRVCLKWPEFRRREFRSLRRRSRSRDSTRASERSRSRATSRSRCPRARATP